MKKRLFVLAVLMSMFVSFKVYSQLQVGDWKLYSVYSGLHVQNIIDTGNIVYYLTDGWLYSYDKENDETIYYNKRNDLSDTNILNIYYNYDKNYLFIIYENANLDILYDNGRVVNIPDLKNKVLTTSKTINAIDFQGDYVYVATDFGFLVIDDEKYNIKESYNYGKKFVSIVATNENIYATFDQKIYVSGTKESHFNISSFKETNCKFEAKMKKIGSDRIVTTDGWFYNLRIMGGYQTTLEIVSIEKTSVKNVSKSKNGYIASFTDSYALMNEKGEISEKIYFPSDFEGNLISSMENDGSVWGIDKNGIKQFKIEGNSITYLHENFRPNVPTVAVPGYLLYDNNRLYAMTKGQDWFLSTGTYRDFGLCSFSSGEWKDLSPKGEINFVNPNSKNTIYDTYSLTIDPDDADKIWFGSWWEGVYCVKNNELIHKFDNTNSPMELNWWCDISSIGFDNDKNLWCVEASPDKVLLLPRDKINRGNVTASDWIVFNIENVSMTYSNVLYITKNNTVLIADNSSNGKLTALNTNGTLENKADDKKVTIASFSDQDGKTFNISYFLAFKEDLNGKLWVGTNNGIGTIDNPESIFSNDFTINRIKVPRNDGTNLADYLLENLSVTCIAVDGANRKWLGTSTSGVYLVNEDGTEILEHFTEENSYLLDNQIVSLECNKDNNAVYIGTSKGLVEYSSDATIAEDNYDNVYAYPNPIRPDYTGYITVKGLMDNSLVKIADAAGNVVFSKLSTGGMVVWDGCNSDGSRVDTGVYYVFASQSEDGNSNGCVTKILIVR